MTEVLLLHMIKGSTEALKMVIVRHTLLISNRTVSVMSRISEARILILPFHLSTSQTDRTLVTEVHHSVRARISIS